MVRGSHPGPEKILCSPPDPPEHGPTGVPEDGKYCRYGADQQQKAQIYLIWIAVDTRRGRSRLTRGMLLYEIHGIWNTQELVRKYATIHSDGLARCEIHCDGPHKALW